MYSYIACAHIASALLSLVAGALVLNWPKGTNRHKLTGYWYVGSMLVLNLTALAIYRLTGHFGPFHIMAFVSLVTLAAGFLPVLLKRPANKWLELHLNFMAWSYIGLLMAAASEVAVRVPGAPFWPGVFIGSFFFFAAGWFQLVRHRNRLLAKHGSAGAQQAVPADGPASRARG